MRILITAGPTREYLDDVRYLSNASSGRMGYRLAEAALQHGHEVVLVSGPVALAPPVGCEFHAVETTGQMRDACVAKFADCDGVIAAAAVCDYKPRNRISGKIAKTGGPVSIEMIETDDVLAELGRQKGREPALPVASPALPVASPALPVASSALPVASPALPVASSALPDRWVVGFALEAENARENALQKLRAKNCDLVVLNGPAAIGSETNSVELIEPTGKTVATFSGSKLEVARKLIDWIDRQCRGND